jgi:rod shape-determining protein MreB
MVDRVASEPFSHPRTVIGTFTTAQAELKALVAETRGGFSLKLDILIHPLERIEGGLTQIEERALLELALGAGASHARVWVGAPLTDQEVMEKLKA